MSQFARLLRSHLPFAFGAPVLILVMTWPTIAHVFDASVFWVSRRDIDVNMLFWDAWYFKAMLAGQADFFYTDLLFHPEGVSLVFHNFCLPHMILFSALQVLLPPANAFNLTYLLLVYLTMLSGYIYLSYVLRDKWISLFGTLVFGASTFVLTRPGQAYINFIATLPLALYFLQRGILEERGKYLLIAGALTGMTAFVGLYTLICMLLTMLFYIPFLARGSWRDARLWSRLLLMGLVAAGFLLLRFYPLLANPDMLGAALAKNAGDEAFNDLVAYFANYGNPITRPLFESLFGPDPVHSDVYLGYVPLLLLLACAASRGRRGEKAIWLAILFLFLILRLGSTLTLNGADYDEIVLPKRFLTEVFPYIFGPFWSTNNFQAGALLPFALLTCFGLQAVLRSVPAKRRRSVIAIFIGLLAFEYYHETDPRTLPPGQFNFLEWLQGEEDQESIRLINLPMGGQNSKYYAFFQSFNGYPHAEGRPTRTPDSAFRYIEGNAMLSAWRRDQSYHCLPGNRLEYHAALDQLLADDFSHILLHKWRALKVVHLNRFAGVAPAYDDHFVTIYRVKDLRRGCENSALIDLGPRFILQESLAPGSILPETGAAVLSIHPDGDGGLSDYYAAAVERPQQVLPLADADLRAEGERDRELQRYDPNTILGRNSVFLLVYDARRSDRDRLEIYREWLGGRMKSCGRESHGADVVLEYYLHVDFTCALLLDSQPRQVAYDNRIELGNLLYEVAGDRLELQLLWRTLPEATHSISVQFVDGEGSRVGGHDFVIGHEPLERHVIDLSGLGPGEYVAKLILYNFETLASVPGRAIASDQRFARELDIAQFEREPQD